jgi:hypothetical protein
MIISNNSFTAQTCYKKVGQAANWSLTISLQRLMAYLEYHSGTSGKCGCRRSLGGAHHSIVRTNELQIKSESNRRARGSGCRRDFATFCTYGLPSQVPLGLAENPLHACLPTVPLCKRQIKLAYPVRSVSLTSSSYPSSINVGFPPRVYGTKFARNQDGAAPSIHPSFFRQHSRDPRIQETAHTLAVFSLGGCA